MKHTKDLEKLCQALSLGTPVSPPVPVSGGLVHNMYRVETAGGVYAIKALNPQIMSRPAAMTNIADSERIALLLSLTVPALPAMVFDGKAIQEINGSYYLIYRWTHGRSLKQSEIGSYHCGVMGGILAGIHKADLSELNIKNDSVYKGRQIDWDYFLRLGREQNTVWADRLDKLKDTLHDCNKRADEANRILSGRCVISHRDLDSKNVLWDADKPTLIDWESAGYTSPLKDLVNTALYWSETDSGDTDRDRLLTFIRSYKERYGELDYDTPWDLALISSVSDKLFWLEYSLKRSLRLDCAGEDEQKLGTSQAVPTLNLIEKYLKGTDTIYGWLNEI